MTEQEVADRIKAVLKDAGIEALITGGRISAFFPDGAHANFTPLELDTADFYSPEDLKELRQ